MDDYQAKLKFAIKYLESAGLSFLQSSEEIIDWRQAAAIAFVVGDVDAARINEPWRPLAEEFAELVRRVEPEIAAFTRLEPAKPLGYPIVFDRSEWIVTAMETIRPLVEPIFQSLISALTDTHAPTRSPAENHAGQSQLENAAQSHGCKADERRGEGAYVRLRDRAEAEDNAADGVFGRASGTPSRAVRSVATIQIGTILGYLSKKVLGQFDLPLASGEVSGEGKLYFIYPNIKMIGEHFNLDRDEFHLWLALHEATHSFEFESNPWLKPYLTGLIREHSDYMKDKLRQTMDQAGSGKASLTFFGTMFTRSARELLSVEENTTLARIQAFMAVIEGYSEYVMHELSGKIIPGSARIDAVFERNKPTKTWAESVLERFMGLDIKMQQYKKGRRFVTAAASAGGIELVNRVWNGPENLPSLTEISHPERWIERVGR